jgi:hypothetical protein
MEKPTKMGKRTRLTVAQAAAASEIIDKGIPASGKVTLPCKNHNGLDECREYGCKNTIVKVGMYESIPGKFRLKLRGGLPFLPVNADTALEETLDQYLESNPRALDSKSERSVEILLTKVGRETWAASGEGEHPKFGTSDEREHPKFGK